MKGFSLSNLDEAIAFAAIAHAGQVRKYTGEPYVLHPIHVMRLLWDGGIKDTDILIAALLHDVVEDTGVNLSTIERRFGKFVAKLVDELTDKFTKEAYPSLNRAKRKQMERERIATTCGGSQTIKYADLISNTESIVPHDPGFARRYLEEKEAILAVANRGEPLMYAAAQHHLQKAQEALVQRSLS